MTNRILILLICFSFFSCATITNRKQTRIEVHTFPNAATICLDNDTCVATPVILEVPRSYSDFRVVVKNDSLEKTIQIRSRVSPEFKWGNLLFSFYGPIGYIIDATSRKKMYTYDNSILVDLSNNKTGYKKWESLKQGQFYIRVSHPWFDFVGFNNGREFNRYNTYIGMTVGIDYYHSKHSYLSLSGGAAGISDMPFPAEKFTYSDTTQNVSSYSVKLTNNHDLNVFLGQNVCFTVGYGLSFTHFSYSQTTSDTLSYKHYDLFRKEISSVGLSFDANFIFLKYYHIGFSVLPSYYTINSHKWEYSYLSYFDFGVRFPIGRHINKNLRVIKYKPKLLE